MYLNEQDISGAQFVLERADTIAITTHSSPDGDAIGSATGLYHVLKNLGKQVSVIIPDAMPDFLAWMDEGQILVGEDHPEKVEKLIHEADVLFCLDYNDPSRVGKQLAPVVSHAEGTTIMIDHHRDPSDIADILFSEITASSSAELVWCFIQDLGWNDRMDQWTAEALYCGMVTDTGSFRFPATSSRVHRIAADLIDRGARNAWVHQQVYDGNTESRIRLHGYALSEKLELNYEHGFALLSLTADELARFNYKKGDTEGLVNQGLSVKGINISIFLSEKDEKVKMSFRSKGDYPVNELASSHFQGGGHLNAAGGISHDDVESTLVKLRALLPDWIQSL